MHQFTVPQYIDVEDKIIGPITVRQFIILLVGVGFGFVAYKTASFVVFIFIALFILIVTVLLAFAKINGRPIHYFFLNVIQTFKKPRLRIWNKILNNADLKEALRPIKEVEAKTIRTKKPVASTRLAELSLLVDTGGVYQGEVIKK
ncbi:MAG: hypothetical protein COT81_03665 [Candidatus Buchananbacteria bacterium CG10_big_fil_rev_8_21_14_0_10_42_9]|uniref:PrgI family protein n=1 Tax=Candidatus Buchananbacteria bacterium CG10_big_fil_rev_8_21_14_0_10_42_9 TaxID=1974526 RepID=A0A2H0W0U6_9BACT|nr:MAG: hypothetical protein COT81_03665 [Candidatus Buchananbacteria bacterium CG10_big_fil_rev_8_21_14_0_10_42_9]